MAPESISRLETGALNVTIEKLAKVAAVLEVPVSGLFDGLPPPNERQLRTLETKVMVLLATLSDDELRLVHRGLKALLGLRKPGSRRPTGKR